MLRGYLSKYYTGGEDGGVGTAVGGRTAVAIGGGGGGGRRGFGDEGVVVALVDGVVEAESGQSIGEALIELVLGGGIESEAQLDAGFELVHVLIGDALAAAVLAVPLAPEPRLIAEGVRRPRSLLEEWRGRLQERRALEQERRRVDVGFRHERGRRRRQAQPLGVGVVRRSRDLARWVRKRYGVVRFLSFGAFEWEGTPLALWIKPTPKPLSHWSTSSLSLLIIFLTFHLSEK